MAERRTGARRAGARRTTPRGASRPPDTSGVAPGAELYLAEKHSIALALADALPGRAVKRDGYIECGGAIITWLSGHLLEQAPPEAYDPALKAWTRETLPIVPERFLLLPRTDGAAARQLAVIEALLRVCPRAVNAADFDREGQLLVDEVLERCGYQGPVRRLQTRALDRVSLTRELGRMGDNREYAGLRDAARARSRLDWLAGINLTRAMTLQGRSQGFGGLLSLGRVQTPTLALVVERDLAIENFVPRPFFRLECRFAHANGPIDTELVTAAGMAGCDEEKRLVDRAEAERLRDLVSGRPGVVQAAEKKLVREAAPLPYSLTELQKEASARHGMGAQATLAAAQALYEGKFISYPRTDCQHLPMEQFAEAPSVLAAVAAFEGMADMVTACDASRRSAAWNTARVSAHHAIIPTVVPARGLSEAQAKIYAMVCRRYAWQFLPEHVFHRTRIDVACMETLWRANGRVEVSPGWTAFRPAPAGRAGAGEEEKRKDRDVILPETAKGDPVTAGRVKIKDAMTTPPPRFTEGTLVDAMEHVQRHVRGASAEDQAVLKKTEGLGTVATRAGIIDTLFARRYLERHGKALQSTPLGRDLVRNSPAVIRDPLMTAAMERSLSEIQDGRLDPDAYVAGYAATLPGVLAEIFAMREGFGEAVPDCPLCGGKLRRHRAAGSWYWTCANAPGCEFRAGDRNGVPVLRRGRAEKDPQKEPHAEAGEADGHACPRCGKPMVLRQGPRGPFWGCSGFPSCRCTAEDRDGAPKPETGAGAAGAGRGSRRASGTGRTRSTKDRAAPEAPPAETPPPGAAAADIIATPDFPPPDGAPGKGMDRPRRTVRAKQTKSEDNMNGEHTCPRCGKPLARRRGPRGSFWGCTGYPSCRYTAEDDEAPAPPMEQPASPSDGAACPRCGRPLALRHGVRGDFWGCTGFPSCRYTADAGERAAADAPTGGNAGRGRAAPQGLPTAAPEVIGDGAAWTCPRCGGELRLRHGARGPFWGCSAYPSCRFSTDDDGGRPVLDGAGRAAAKPTQARAATAAAAAEGEGGHVCPRCGRPMVLRHSSRGPFWGCSGFPGCRATVDAAAEEAAAAERPRVGAAAAAAGPAARGPSRGPAPDDAPPWDDGPPPPDVAVPPDDVGMAPPPVVGLPPWDDDVPPWDDPEDPGRR